MLEPGATVPPPGDCEVSEETLGSHHYRVIQYPDAGLRHFPDATTRCPQGTEPAEAGCRIADGHLFVLGDNRDNSSDSRFWGAVPFSHLKGVATSVHFSLSPKATCAGPASAGASRNASPSVRACGLAPSVAPRLAARARGEPPSVHASGQAHPVAPRPQFVHSATGRVAAACESQSSTFTSPVTGSTLSRLRARCEVNVTRRFPGAAAVSAAVLPSCPRMHPKFPGFTARPVPGR